MSDINTAAVAAVEAAPIAEATPAPQAPKNPNRLVQDDAPVAEAAPAVAASDAKAVAAIENKDPKDLTAKEKSLVKKYQLKIDGKTEDFELDLSNDEEIKKHLQMSRASSKRMQESAQMKSAAEEFINLLKTDPKRVLSDPNIGVDLKKLAQEIINKEIEDAQKSPEQLQIEKYQKELEEIKAKQEKEEKERTTNERIRLQKEHEEKIQVNIETALKGSDLPKTPYTVRKMAEMMLIALQNNVDLSPADLVPLIRKQMIADYKELTSAANDDILEELIGKENLTRVRKKTVAKVKQQVAQTANSVKDSGKAAAPKAADKPKIKLKDWLNS